MKLTKQQINDLIKAASFGKYTKIESINVGGVEYRADNYPITFQLS